MAIQEKQKETVSATCYDDAWKDVLDHFLQAFMELCLPADAESIDWSHPYISLETELRAITHGRITKGVVDKLFQVSSKHTDENRLLHIEVQIWQKNNFPNRMYTYHVRLLDRYKQPITSIAILADASQNWRPRHYQHTFGSTHLCFEFAIVKLRDREKHISLLSCGLNPFEIVIYAHLESLKTKGNFARRLESKLAVTCVLYEYKLNQESARRLFEFIDQVMVLPKSLAIEYAEQVWKLEEEKKMAYITSIQRLGIEQGLEQGLQSGLLQGREQGIPLGEVRAARKLLRAGHAFGYVVETLGLSPALAEQLRQSDVDERF